MWTEREIFNLEILSSRFPEFPLFDFLSLCFEILDFVFVFVGGLDTEGFFGRRTFFGLCI